MESSLEVLAQKGKEGDRTALEELIRRIQDRVYGISLRMLYHPADAEDAAQKILLKIVILAVFVGRVPLPPGCSALPPLTCKTSGAARRSVRLVLLSSFLQGDRQLIAKSRKSLLYAWQLGLVPWREHPACLLFIHTKPARKF